MVKKLQGWCNSVVVILMYFVLYIPELVGGAPRGAGLKGKVVMIFHCEHKVNFNFFLK